MASGFFITGTDTGVGKTIIAGAVIQYLQARGVRAGGMKPIETGCYSIGSSLYPSDGMFLKKVAGMEENINHITPYCFRESLAPLVAAEREGKSISSAAIIRAFSLLLKRYESVVVEGVGGILVPIKRKYFVLDLMRDLGLPVIVVSRPSLGTLNHTLLTVNYALNEGIEVAGIVINFTRPPDGDSAEETNPDIIQRLSPVPVLGVFPYIKDVEPEILKKNALQCLRIRIKQ